MNRGLAAIMPTFLFRERIVEVPFVFEHKAAERIVAALGQPRRGKSRRLALFSFKGPATQQGLFLLRGVRFQASRGLRGTCIDR
jgi:hypothetical protein